MADFKAAYDLVKQYEGGYANNPNDTGGETYAGIARNFHSAWEGWPIIDAMKALPEFPASLGHHGELAALVGVFYLKVFWSPIKGDELTYQEIANLVYDTAVNFGAGKAIRWLQGSLNEIGAQLDVDGVMGTKTLAAVKTLGSSARLLVVRGIRDRRLRHRVAVCREDHSQVTFLLGWVARDLGLPC